MVFKAPQVFALLPDEDRDRAVDYLRRGSYSSVDTPAKEEEGDFLSPVSTAVLLLVLAVLRLAPQAKRFSS